MPDATYDAVIIGGGHNGFVLGLYLQKAGMDVVILERNQEVGGGLCGDEVPLPGFLTNTCATNVRFYIPPVYRDFHLYDYGLEHIFTDAGAGMVFDDETCFVTYPLNTVIDIKTGEVTPNPQNRERTLKEIARFSQRDAEVAANLMERYERKWHSAYMRYMYNPPTPPGVKNTLEELLDDPVWGFDPKWLGMNFMELAYELFESDAMRSYFIAGNHTSTGNWPGDPLDIFTLAHAPAVIFSMVPPSLIRGGSHSIIHALLRAFEDIGGEFFVGKEVDKVIVENGQARGVRLTDGTQIKARKLVASEADVRQNLFRFLGDDAVSPELAESVKKFRFDRMCVFWGSAALHELPDYKATSFNPDCNRMPRTIIGPKDPEYYAGIQQECFERAINQRPKWWTGPDTVWDKTRAPEGKHLVQLEIYTCPADQFSEMEWMRLKREMMDKLCEEWPKYAPNMTRDNIIDMYLDTPLDSSRRNINMINGAVCVGSLLPSQEDRNRPCPELSGYRMPIKGYYLCSNSGHVGGGIRAAAGYCCYKMVAEDFDLPKPWEEAGRSY